MFFLGKGLGLDGEGPALLCFGWFMLDIGNGQNTLDMGKGKEQVSLEGRKGGKEKSRCLWKEEGGGNGGVDTIYAGCCIRYCTRWVLGLVL